MCRNGEEVGCQYSRFQDNGLMRFSYFIFEVQCSDTITYLVDLSRYFWSCNYWHIEYFPCSHVVVCVSCNSSSFYNYCDLYFLSFTSRLTYEQCVHPVLISYRLNEVFEIVDVLAPISNVLQEGQSRIE